MQAALYVFATRGQTETPQVVKIKNETSSNLLDSSRSRAFQGARRKKGVVVDIPRARRALFDKHYTPAQKKIETRYYLPLAPLEERNESASFPRSTHQTTKAKFFLTKGTNKKLKKRQGRQAAEETTRTKSRS